MSGFQTTHLTDLGKFQSVAEGIEQANPDLKLRLGEVAGEALLGAEFGGVRVCWLYDGEGQVFLPQGYRTKEGDGQGLPEEYEPGRTPPLLAERLAFLQERMDDISVDARAPLADIISRQRNGTFVGDFANDLWKLGHTPEEWSQNGGVVAAIRSLFEIYRDCGYSVKSVDSFEKIMEGDQLIAAGQQKVRAKGHFRFFSIEKVNRETSHISTARRLRYLKDTSGGCNFAFDPFRRCPLTWYVTLPGERGNGPNFVNSHVVNIPRETSPTHFHPRQAVGGGRPQDELYLVLDPRRYGLSTYGRKACLIVYPDLADLDWYEQHALEPGGLAYIPAGMAHRGIDVFVNVITIPGFIPHNEYYVDQDICERTGGRSPYNHHLLGIKNYDRLEDFL